MANSLVGQTVNRYHIIEQLGEGGMATVFKAYDVRLERYVAIKFIRSELAIDSTFLHRFHREAKALAQLSHPNIVKVLDYGEHNFSPYLVMEYLPGGTLKEKLGKPMIYQDAARLLIPIARAVDYAHQHKIIHRDLKPSNFLLTDSGEPMLSDFGIAKILESDMSGGLTGSGVGIGTPEYMAPEQAYGKPVDCRADIYALGVVFFELVTGQKPYRADTPMAVILKHISDPLPNPRQINPTLPDVVEQVIYKALAKNPEERYDTMAAFANALERLAEGKSVPAELRTVTPTPPAGPGIPTSTASSSATSSSAPAISVAPPITHHPPHPASQQQRRAILIPIALALLVCSILTFATITGIFGASFLFGGRSSLQPTKDLIQAAPLLPEQTGEPITDPNLCAQTIELPVETDYPVALCDMFDNDAKYWISKEVASKPFEENMEITNGVYHTEIVAKQEIFYIARPSLWEDRFYNYFSDMVYSVNAQQLDGDTESTYYGIYFRGYTLDAPPFYWYFYGINNGRQEYTLWHMSGDEWKKLIGPIKSDAIQRDGSNQLTVNIHSNTIELFVNGQAEGRYKANNADYPINEQSGELGFAIKMEQPAQAIFEFDNFVVRAPYPD